jgi:CRISPR-associated protein Cas2
MYILITYDVNTVILNGEKRLRKVAKTCINYGQRVQNSVFECELSDVQLVVLKNKLSDIIDKENDSIRIYHLGKIWDRKIETIGKNNTYKVDSTIII